MSLDTKLHFSDILAPEGTDPEAQEKFFAVFLLGLIGELRQGKLEPEDAIRSVFHAENCQFVRDHFRSRLPDKVMSRGVQLADLFDALPAKVAYREFLTELRHMRTTCHQILTH